MIDCICKTCGKHFKVFPSRLAQTASEFCSCACYAQYRRRPLAERFWEKVDKTAGPDSCWLWTASKNSNGYGVIGDRHAHHRQAHRVAYELCVGPIPKGLCVCHHCDVPACVNPSHLFLGTLKDNAQDMVSKGRDSWHTHPECVASGKRHGSCTHPERVARGEKSGVARLAEHQVREIRIAYAQGGISQRELARRYKVSETAILSIIRRKTWKHITP